MQICAVLSNTYNPNENTLMSQYLSNVKKKYEQSFEALYQMAPTSSFRVWLTIMVRGQLDFYIQVHTKLFNARITSYVLTLFICIYICQNFSMRVEQKVN